MYKMNNVVYNITKQFSWTYTIKGLLRMSVATHNYVYCMFLLITTHKICKQGGVAP